MGDITYDSSNDRIVVIYQDADDSHKGKAVVGTVSGTSITFGTPVALHLRTFGTIWGVRLTRVIIKFDRI